MTSRRKYAAAATLATALCLTPAVEAQAQDVVSQTLAAHNSARAQYGARPLTWSTALAPTTALWAAQCRFAHSDPQGKYGENLYATTNLSAGVTDAVKSWVSEASQYNYASPTFSPYTGHFTQVVWKSTTSVAAIAVTCPAGTIFSQPSVFVVARYAPPGNVIGQFPQNVGRPA